MPRYNGTGPRGQGPLTGRGEGYCAVTISEPGEQLRGVAGLEGGPVSPTRAGARLPFGARFAPWLRPRAWFGRGFGRGLGRGRGADRGRGRRSGRW